MGLLLPALAIVTFAVLAEPRKAPKALPPVEPPEPLLPPNVTLLDPGDFAWGVTVIFGPDIDKDKTEVAMDAIVESAKAYPALVFEVALDDDSEGITVFFVENGIAYERWVEQPEDLADVLAENLEGFTGP
jgi:hypothetical protein